MSDGKGGLVGRWIISTLRPGGKVFEALEVRISAAWVRLMLFAIRTAGCSKTCPSHNVRSFNPSVTVGVVVRGEIFEGTNWILSSQLPRSLGSTQLLHVYLLEYFLTFP